MTERMIDDMYARRIKNTLKEIDSPRQELTFNQLKIYYEEHGLKLNDNFLQNLRRLCILYDEGSLREADDQHP